MEQKTNSPLNVDDILVSPPDHKSVLVDGDLGEIVSTLKPYVYRHNKDMFSFLFCGKECILIPYPHIDMNHSFLLEHHYRGIDYSFSMVKEETMISFFGTEQYNTGNRYNVFLEGHYFVVPLSKIGGLIFQKKPNEKFDYLVATPFQDLFTFYQRAEHDKRKNN